MRLLVLAGLGYGFAFAGLEVQVKAVDAQAVGGGPRPVNVFHDRRAFRRAEITLGAQPSVQVELHPEVGKAVIAHHEDRRLAAVKVDDFADDRVQPSVQLLDVPKLSLRFVAGSDRVLVAPAPPEPVGPEIAAGAI